jgi:para-nitrobenzyl esterase
MNRDGSNKLFALLVIIFCTAVPALAQISSAKVTCGVVESVVKNGIAAFRGIPFAAPPVGDLHWRSLQPVKPWQGVRKESRHLCGVAGSPI